MNQELSLQWKSTSHGFNFKLTELVLGLLFDTRSHHEKLHLHPDAPVLWISLLQSDARSTTETQPSQQQPRNVSFQCFVTNQPVLFLVLQLKPFWCSLLPEHASLTGCWFISLAVLCMFPSTTAPTERTDSFLETPQLFFVQTHVTIFSQDWNTLCTICCF